MVWSTPGLDTSVVGCREEGREEDSIGPFSLCRTSEQDAWKLIRIVQVVFAVIFWLRASSMLDSHSILQHACMYI